MLVAALRPPRIWSAPSFERWEAQPSLLDASAGSLYVKLLQDKPGNSGQCTTFDTMSTCAPNGLKPPAISPLPAAYPSSRGDILDSCRWYRTWWSRLCMCLRLCVRGVGNVIWFKSNSQDLRPFNRNIFLPTNACIQFTASFLKICH